MLVLSDGEVATVAMLVAPHLAQWDLVRFSLCDTRLSEAMRSAEEVEPVWRGHCDAAGYALQGTSFRPPTWRDTYLSNMCHRDACFALAVPVRKYLNPLNRSRVCAECFSEIVEKFARLKRFSFAKTLTVDSVELYVRVGALPPKEAREGG